MSQTSKSQQKNEEFFLGELEIYKNNVSDIDTYHRISEVLNSALAGAGRVLDIGNGGVFDYDTSRVREIVGLDLFLEKLPTSLVIPSNVRMVQGSALEIPDGLGTFDTVVMVMLIHHLVGRTAAECAANVEQSFKEAFRVLAPGGRLLLMDSFVPPWFYAIEKVVFIPASWVIERTLKHPPVLQYTLGHASALMRQAGFREIKEVEVPRGKYILQFGVKVPTSMTPTRPALLVGEKPQY